MRKTRSVAMSLMLAISIWWLWTIHLLAESPAPQEGWALYVNETFGWSIRYPANWHINQGDFGPPPPATTKFSTYTATPGYVVKLTPADAEVWVIVTDASSAGTLPDLASRGYKERKITVAGLDATRYTAAQPAFGLYDAVIVPVDAKIYRIYLSASTRDFDAIFQTMLDSLHITSVHHNDAGFTVRYPAGWSVKQEDGGVVFEPPAGKGDVQFRVLYQSAARMSAGQWIANDLRQAAEQGTIENMVSSTSATTLAGVEATKVSYRYRRMADQVEINGTDIGLRMGEALYILRYTAKAEDYERWADAFQLCAGSFRVHDIVTIGDILAEPARYQDQTVTLVATVRGWQKPSTEHPAIAAPPVTRSDWLIEENGHAMYVAANASLTSDSVRVMPSRSEDMGKRLRIIGVVRLTDEGYPYLEPSSIYPEVAGLWMGRAEPSERILAVDLTQLGAKLSGQLWAFEGQKQVGSAPVAGSVVEGTTIRLSTPANASIQMHIEGMFAADGRSFGGTWKGAKETSGTITMKRTEPSILPETGGSLIWRTSVALILLFFLAAGIIVLGTVLCLGVSYRWKN